ncbi:MAG: hypothetical protein QOJ34_608 [Pseudonocardiales bacterium]|nr:hypothetical protein [Pseudonocardiales bacterium]
MTSIGPESEELLDPARPLFPRRVRTAVLLLAALGVAAAVTVFAWPDSHRDTPVAATSALGSTTSTPPIHHPKPTSRRWPTEPAACGSTAELPLVKGAVPIGRGTGISVLVGGTRLARVDFDSGRVTPIPGAGVSSDEYAIRFVGSRPDYALVLNCRGPDVHGPRLLRLTASGSLLPGPPRRFDDVLVDGDTSWGLRWATAGSSGVLVPLDGGPRVSLPREFNPWFATRGVLVGNLVGADGGPGPLVLVDADTGRIQLNLGVGEPLAASDGILVWTTGCEIGVPTPCRVRQRDLTTGRTTDYRLPRSPGFSPTVISPDHKLLACTLERRQLDPRFVNDHPLPPVDVVVLHLDTGALDIVPGVELPAKTAPAFGFSADGWLVMALDAGGRTRLLAWRHGMLHPFEAPAVPGRSYAPPALAVLPRS